MAQHFYLGLAIWAYKGWLGDLFPASSAAKDLLRLYSQRLSTVEGNTTFYAIPSEQTVRLWQRETPEDFRFCFKLPRDISHAGPLALTIDATRAFVERLAPLGPRIGPYFLQLPPHYNPRQIDDLERWLAAWNERYDPRDLTQPRITVEVRHPAWYAPPAEEALMQLLERYQAGRVIMDVRPLRAGPLPGAEEDLQRARDRKPDVPMHPLRSSDIALVRYISHPDAPLNDRFLDEWAQRVAEWLREGVTVYTFIHCPQEERSPGIARWFQQRLAQRAEILALPLLNDEQPRYENATLPGFE